MQLRKIRGLVGILTLFLISHSLMAEDDTKEAGKKPTPETSSAGESKQPPDYESLIDSLANRKNQPPVIVKDVKNTVPVFFEPFDADEQDRVRAVVHSLVRYPGNDLWPHLRAHSNDQRYALTYTEEPRSVDVDAKNETVAHVCFTLVCQLMDYPCKKHLPKRGGKKDKMARGIPSFPHPTEMKTLGRKGKIGRLDEVQTEICEFVLDNPTRLTGMSDEEREKFLDGVRQEIEQLKRTEVALMPEKFDFTRIRIGPRGIDIYREKYGERARQQLEQEKQKEKP